MGTAQVPGIYESHAPPSQHTAFYDESEVAFLDENDISKWFPKHGFFLTLTNRRGRFFDASTLPFFQDRHFFPGSIILRQQKKQNESNDGRRDSLLPGSKDLKQKPEDAQERNALGSNVAPRDSTQSKDSDPAWLADAINLPTCKEEESTLTSHATPSPLHQTSKSSQNVQIHTSSSHQGIITPSRDIPSKTDNASALPQVIDKTILIQETHDKPQKGQTPPHEVQEDRSSRNWRGKDEHDHENEAEISGQGLEDSMTVGESTGTGQETRRDGVASDTFKPDAEAGPSTDEIMIDAQGGTELTPNGILKLQREGARKQSNFVESPSTPDEQLRSEEARTLQLSSMKNNRDDDDHEIDSSQDYATDTTAQFSRGQLDQEPVPTVMATTNDSSQTRHPASYGFKRSVQSQVPSTPGLKTGEQSKNLTLSRRPPMRIDTDVPSINDALRSLPPKKTTPGAMNGYALPDLATPNKTGVSAQSPPERMTTRVSSGALRHKSVSEILGETPKPGSHTERNGLERDEAILQTPRSSTTGKSPDPALFKLRLNELQEKKGSKLSTVVFARSQPSDQPPAEVSESTEFPHRVKPYLHTLFAAQSCAPPRSQQLSQLVASAHKTLSTANQYLNFREQQDCRLLNRIYQHQYKDKWPLRQLRRATEPERSPSHWDVLLSHMKWMRTDFREEAKWKTIAAKFLADSCAAFVTSSPEDQSSMRVKVRLPSEKQAVSKNSTGTPDLIPSAEDDPSDTEMAESPPLEAFQESVPAAMFSSAPDMFIFGLNRSPITEKLLDELPLYQPAEEIEEAILLHKEYYPDATWKRPILPVSKYVEGKLKSQGHSPPRKKSRYAYEQNGDDLDISRSAPEQNDVALFNPEFKHVLDRIHTGHAFRPPSEFAMPSQSFFESRQSSQWTPTEEEDLRRLVREYSFNWSLVSDCLSSPAMFSSGAERRTPWECFERWIALEGLPQDMSKLHYFRAYRSRLEAARATVEAQQQALQQQQSTNVAQMPIRRRTTHPIQVEQRKNIRHLRTIDAMRRLAKKREAALSKQQHGKSFFAL